MCMNSFTDVSSSGLPVRYANYSKKINFFGAAGESVLILHWKGDRTVAITCGTGDL